MKPIDKRLNEIKELQKHIGKYAKTKDIYVQYRKVGYSKKFLLEFEDKIILHENAKRVFNELNLKKLPTIKMLKNEYATLKSEKNKLYNEYRKSKEQLKKLSIIKSNTDRLLAYSENKKHKKRPTTKMIFIFKQMRSGLENRVLSHSILRDWETSQQA